MQTICQLFFDPKLIYSRDSRKIQMMSRCGDKIANNDRIDNDSLTKTNFRKNQTAVRSVLERLMSNVQADKQTTKVKQLPRKYFEDVPKSKDRGDRSPPRIANNDVRLSKSDTTTKTTIDPKLFTVNKAVDSDTKTNSNPKLECPVAKDECKAYMPNRTSGDKSMLFNPHYNFKGKNIANASPSIIKFNLIENMKRLMSNERFRHEQTLEDTDSDYSWDDDGEPSNKYKARMSRRYGGRLCKTCERNRRMLMMMMTRRREPHRNVETQTVWPNSYSSAVPSRASVNVSSTSVPFPKGFCPCTKNLLCTLGHHSDGACVFNCEDQQSLPYKDARIDHKTERFSPRDNVWQRQWRMSRGDASIDDDYTDDEQLINPCESSTKSDNKTNIAMNGLNGHSANGDLNGCGDIITQNQQKGCWTIGLINSKFRYLTAETFGFKINANGTSLKKKQIWTLEPDSSNGSESMIYLRSHLDKYLAVDSFGNVTCESDEKDPGSKFQISVAEDGTGRWAFRNVVRGYFLGSSSDKLTCTAKVPGEAEFWHVHLAARPQVNLRSVGRKRFAHLSENLDEIHVDANIPWGEDTLFTLEFRADESGKYAIHTCNNKYLSCGGKLVDACGKDCLFTAEYHSGQLALRDHTGAYLSPIGSKAVLKSRSQTVTKDELFSLEDSLPQASFVAALNARYVSVKQGVDVTANQDEISDHETFQLEFDWSTKRWYIRTMQDRYWTLETGGGIQAAGDKRSSNALFDLVWQGDGSVAFRANNGRYIITKRSGHLYATSDTVDENCKYFFYLVNRPILVLKCEQGFVGYKSTTNPKLECNKATYETIQVERGEKGVVHFKGLGGKYWHVDSEGVTVDADVPEPFYLELREPTRLCIKSANGNYLTASKNGVFRLGDSTIDNATQWEY